jgi:uncharacterized protein YoxC
MSISLEKVLGLITQVSGAASTIEMLYKTVEGVVKEVKGTLSETDAQKLEEALDNMRAERLERSKVINAVLDEAATRD